MNAATNALEWIQGQAIPIICIIIIGVMVFMGWNRNFAKLIGAILFLSLIFALVVNPQSLLTLGNQLWGMLRG